MDYQNLEVVENGLIPIFQNANEESLVLGSDIHAALGVNKKKVDYLRYQNESLEFEEGKDFAPISQKRERGLGTGFADYVYTLEAAKHIALASRTKKGKEVRNYFIQFEKKAKQFIANELKMLKAENEMLRLKSVNNVDAIAKSLIDSTKLANTYLQAKEAENAIESVINVLISTKLKLLSNLTAIKRDNKEELVEAIQKAVVRKQIEAQV